MPTQTTRREILKTGLAAGAALAAGPQHLVVDARLEDLAGNNFIKAFETPSGSTPLPSMFMRSSIRAWSETSSSDPGRPRRSR